MTANDNSLRRCNNFTSMLAALALVLFALSAAYFAFNQSDSRISGQRAKHHQTTGSLSLQFSDVSADEQRISRLFATDTLPRLLQHGLVMKYERDESGTILKVAGDLWKGRSLFFKRSLLTERVVYNGVNGYEPSTQIRDYRTGHIFAAIKASAWIELYD